ncbi:hypothetical protein GMRT_13373 [Giardia muris]|uniref:Uncharacterized protein n=1 Tax=Giardia muris TaxID=5742 RepID=A0A4Z1SLF1_GIAMU|nr:hypothetical protein GMRT_13373 [Giardia muris]|eukprot:TNJ26340.1 hypothetical protein GMRT_13373 [Giardia muris]
MFRVKDDAYRLASSLGETVLGRYDAKANAWVSVYLPGSVRTQSRAALRVAAGPMGVFILSQKEGKVYQLLPDMTFSRHAALLRVPSLSSNLSGVIHYPKGFCVVGFGTDRKGYFITGASGGKGARFLLDRLLPNAQKYGSSFPYQVLEVHACTAKDEHYLVARHAPNTAMFLGLDVEKHTMTALGSFVLSDTDSIAYVAAFRSLVICVVQVDGLNDGSRLSRASCSLARYYAVVLCTHRVGDTTENNAVVVLPDIPHIFGAEFVEHEGGLLSFDGTLFSYDPLTALLRTLPPSAFVQAKPPSEESLEQAMPASESIGPQLADDDPSQAGNDVLLQSINASVNVSVSESQSFAASGRRFRTPVVRPAIDSDVAEQLDYLGFANYRDYPPQDLPLRTTTLAVKRLRLLEDYVTDALGKLTADIEAIRNEVSGNTQTCEKALQLGDFLSEASQKMDERVTSLEERFAELARRQLVSGAACPETTKTAPSYPTDTSNVARSRSNASVGRAASSSTRPYSHPAYERAQDLISRLSSQIDSCDVSPRRSRCSIGSHENSELSRPVSSEAITRAMTGGLQPTSRDLALIYTGGSVTTAACKDSKALAGSGEPSKEPSSGLSTIPLVDPSAQPMLASQEVRGRPVALCMKENSETHLTLPENMPVVPVVLHDAKSKTAPVDSLILSPPADVPVVSARDRVEANISGIYASLSTMRHPDGSPYMAASRRLPYDLVESVVQRSLSSVTRPSPSIIPRPPPKPVMRSETKPPARAQASPSPRRTGEQDIASVLAARQLSALQSEILSLREENDRMNKSASASARLYSVMEDNYITSPGRVADRLHSLTSKIDENIERAKRIERAIDDLEQGK